jgi:uncharacterized iron-regulated membrane protein
MSARRFLRLAHGWLGAIAALFLIAAAASGAALAFMSDIFLAQYGDVLRAEAPARPAFAPDLTRIIAAAEQGYGKPFQAMGVFMPGARVPKAETAMVFGTRPGGAGLEDTLILSVDPHRATFKGWFVLDDAIGHQLIHFHHELFAGEIGATITSVLGLLLAAFALTGLWLWWPRTGGLWRKASSVSLGGGMKRAMFNLHGWAGVWTALLVLLFGVTGTAVSRPGWFGPLLQPAPYDAPAAFTRVCPGAISASAALATAAGAGELRTIGLPGPRSHYRFSFFRPGDRDALGGDLIVFVHRSCPGVRHIVDMRAGSVAGQASQLMFPLHGGYSFGPVLGPILVILTGLVCLLLAVSGLIVFFTRTLKLGRGRAEPELLPQPAE